MSKGKKSLLALAAGCSLLLALIPVSLPAAAADIYGNGNYIVGNAMAEEADFGGTEAKFNPHIAEDAGTPSPDGKALGIQFPKWESGSPGDFSFSLDFGDADLSGAEAFAFWYKFPQGPVTDEWLTHIKLVVDGKEHELKTYKVVSTGDKTGDVLIEKEDNWIVQLPTGAEGFMIATLDELGEETQPENVTALNFASEWSTGDRVSEKEFYIDDLGIIKDVDKFIHDLEMAGWESPIPAPDTTPEYLYHIGNGLTSDEYLPATADAANPRIVSDESLLSPDGKAFAATLKEAEGAFNPGNFEFSVNFGTQDVGSAEALAFWYSLPGDYTPDALKHWYVYLDFVSGSKTRVQGSQDHEKLAYTVAYTGGKQGELGGKAEKDWVLQLPVGTEGYVIVTADQLAGSGFTLEDLTGIRLRSETADYLAAQVSGQDILIDDIGLVDDVDAFIEAVKTIGKDDEDDVPAPDADVDYGYHIGNGLTSDAHMPSEIAGATDAQILEDNSLPTPDGKAFSATMAVQPTAENPDGDDYIPGNFTFGLNFGDADCSKAEALVFWYSLPEAGGEWFVYADLLGPDGAECRQGSGNPMPYRILHTGDSLGQEVLDKLSGNWVMQLPAGKEGYVIIPASALEKAEFTLADVTGLRFRSEQAGYLAGNVSGKPVLLDDIGLVDDVDAFIEAVKGGSGESGVPAADPSLDYLYHVGNALTSDAHLPGASSGTNPRIVDDSTTLSPDGKAFAATMIDSKGAYSPGDFSFSLNFGDQDISKAEALVFWYSIPHETTALEPWWHVYIDLQGPDGKVRQQGAGDHMPYQIIHTGKNIGDVDDKSKGDWITRLTVNKEGYVIIPAEALENAGFTLQELTGVSFRSEWASSLLGSIAGEDILIDDIGLVDDVDAFIEAVKTANLPEYELAPLEEGDDIVVDGECEATTATFTWNAFKDTYRYLVNLYRVDGENYRYYRQAVSSETETTFSDLTASTEYAVQVLAVDKDQNVLSASNLLAFTTAQRDIPAYEKGILEYDETLTADGVNVGETTAEVSWNWISGVDNYKVNLYTVEGGTYTYVKTAEADSGSGLVEFIDLEKGTDYAAQIVAYDMSDSIIFAYKPAAFTTKTTGGEIHDGDGGQAVDDDGSDNTKTGVGAPAAAVLLAAAASGVLLLLRRRRI